MLTLAQFICKGEADTGSGNDDDDIDYDGEDDDDGGLFLCDTAEVSALAYFPDSSWCRPTTKIHTLRELARLSIMIIK